MDAHAETIDLTSRIISILFGADMSTAIPQITKFKSVNDELLRRGLAPHAVPIWIPTRAKRPNRPHPLGQSRGTQYAVDRVGCRGTTDLR